MHTEPLLQKSGKEPRRTFLLHEIAPQLCIHPSFYVSIKQVPGHHVQILIRMLWGLGVLAVWPKRILDAEDMRKSEVTRAEMMPQSSRERICHTTKPERSENDIRLDGFDGILG